jgi:hypothetical protein
MYNLNKIIIIFSLVVFSACSKNDKNMDANQSPNANFDKRYYNDSLPQILTDQVSANLGILVQIENPKDFINEYKYNQMLNILDRNASVIRANSEGVSKILLTNDTDIQGTIGNFILSLSIDLDETSVIKYFKTGYSEIKESMLINRELSNKIRVSLKDRQGVTLNNLAEVSEKLSFIGRQVEFAQDPSFQVLTLGEYFSITSEGASIDIKAPSRDIVIYLKGMIAARNQWHLMVDPILAEMNLKVSFQPGVFNATELLQLIANFKQNAVIFKSTLTQFSQIVLGKRWDCDYSKKVLLADYSFVGETLRAKLLELNPIPDNIEFDKILTELKESFQKKSVQLEDIVIDLPRTRASILKLQSFESLAVSQLEVKNFNKLKITKLVFQENSVDPILLVQGTHTLFLNLPTSAQAIETYLGQVALVNDFNTERFQLLEFAKKLGLTLDLQLSNYNSINTERIKSLNQWLLTGELSPELAVSLAIKELVVGVFNVETSPTQIKEVKLIINFNDFQPDRMKDILK